MTKTSVRSYASRVPAQVALRVSSSFPVDHPELVTLRSPIDETALSAAKSGARPGHEASSDESFGKQQITDWIEEDGVEAGDNGRVHRRLSRHSVLRKLPTGLPRLPIGPLGVPVVDPVVAPVQTGTPAPLMVSNKSCERRPSVKEGPLGFGVNLPSVEDDEASCGISHAQGSVIRRLDHKRTLIGLRGRLESRTRHGEVRHGCQEHLLLSRRGSLAGDPEPRHCLCAPYTCPYTSWRWSAMAAASARLEFRVRPERKSRIERAAELVHEPVSEFARTAAEEKAERVIREHEATTTVPADFFDDLLDALDAAPRANAALARAAQRARETLIRD